MAQVNKVRVLDGESGAGLALHELDGGAWIFAVGSKDLDGAGRVGFTVPARVNERQRAAAQRLKEFVAWNRCGTKHGTILELATPPRVVVYRPALQIGFTQTHTRRAQSVTPVGMAARLFPDYGTAVRSWGSQFRSGCGTIAW
jgi:hypothetical protein